MPSDPIGLVRQTAASEILAAKAPSWLDGWKALCLSVCVFWRDCKDVDLVNCTLLSACYKERPIKITLQLAATLSPRNLLLCRPDAFTRAWPWPTYHHKPARVAGAPGDQNPVERSTREPAPFNCLPRGSRSTSRTPFLLKKGDAKCKPRFHI